MLKRKFLKATATIMVVCTLVLVNAGFVLGEVESALIRSEIRINGVDCEITQQLIINANNGELTATPHSILCIFGHSVSTGIARDVQCRVWATAPRCLERVFYVYFCTHSDCDWLTYTLRSEARISCCQ
ncbi:MAG: hypothetical protein FWF76_04630 [Oscillospiraceae bacterium]|nr:hypothetical protein [Oscillospiraceae bacterium]